MAKSNTDRVVIDGQFIRDNVVEGVRTFVAPIRGVANAVGAASRPRATVPETIRPPAPASRS